jgi:hypothetical protein
MLDIIFYSIYRYFEKIIKDNDPVFFSRLLFSLVESLVLFIPYQAISLFYFDVVPSKWIGIAVWIIIVIINMRVYGNKKVNSVLKKQPTFFPNKSVSHIFSFIIIMILFACFLGLPILYNP